MGYELIITEKPSVAKKLATALCDGKANEKREGSVPYYLITHNKKDIIVCCAVGHLFTVAEKAKNDWKYPIFDIKWVESSTKSKESAFTKKYADVIKKLAKDAEEITVATDYDIEGEVIGYNVVRYLCKKNDANRMKFSALTKQDLVKSYANKSKTLNWGQVNAGTTRHELDWFYGINLSRALSQAIKKAGKFKILSSGRVQGPALKILCDKENKILEFKSTPYWELKAQIQKNNSDIDAMYEKNPLSTEKEAFQIKEKTNGMSGIVDSVTKKEFQQQAPNPFDLTSIQMEAYRLFNIQPKDTLSILQELYVGGWTSYPRTSSQKLPKDLGYETILSQLSKNEKYKKLCDKLLDQAKKSPLKPNEGSKTDDAHPAIYPTGINPLNLDGRQLKMYDLVVKRFFATFGESAIRENVKIVISINEENFIAKGTRTTYKGWHIYYDPYVRIEEIELPLFIEKETIPKVNVLCEEKKTNPPKRYTPASIIKELEKRGLGTKATRAQIVENLYDRGYLNEKSIAVTEIGLNTCGVLEKYCPEILDEKLTREIEDEMEEIRSNTKKPEEVKAHAISFLTNTLKNFKEKEKEIGLGLLNATVEADSFGPCPACKEGKMVLRKGKFGRFLACNKYPDCKNILNVPNKGKLSSVDLDEQEEGHFYINITMPKKSQEKVDLIINKINKEDREKVLGEGEVCDKCGKGKMVYRQGVYGSFLGCSNYPTCKNIKQIEKKQKSDNEE